MIIRNNFNKKDYVTEQKIGLKKAIDKLDERFQKGEIEREKFLKQNEIFAKRQRELNKKR